MTLGQRQELFAKLEAEWVLRALKRPGVTLRQGEGRILTLGPDGKSGRRAYLVGGKGSAVRVQDAVHMLGGCHYQGLAKDWQLFLDGHHVEDGGHQLWRELGEDWERSHPLARWGGRFNDANHISIESVDGKK
jgi:hypothetical protein